MDKDKLFIIIYMNVGSVNSADVPVYLEEIERATRFDESIVRLIIPVREGETRVECVNPKLLNEENYKEVEETIEKIKKLLDEKKW